MSDLDNLVPTPDEMPRISTMQVGYNLIVNLLLKCWFLCSVGSLILILFYCEFGGFFSIILLHIGVAGILYRCQDMLLYHPDTPADSRLYVPSPLYFGLPFESHYIHTPDGCILHAYLLKHLQNTRSLPTIIHFHGNAGNIGHRLYDANQLYKACNVNVILLEYRGYGRSTGNPSEAGLMLDASTTLDYFSSHRDLDPSKFIIFGRSLGGAVAIQVAANTAYNDNHMALIVENTFSSIPHMALSLFKIKYFSFVPEVFYKNKFVSEKWIRKIKLPTLFLSGLKDELVPPTMMGFLFQICNAPLKRFVSFSTGQHNDTWTCHSYTNVINSFIAEVNEYKEGKPIASVSSYNVLA